jgi:hypothetical protein
VTVTSERPGSEHPYDLDEAAGRPVIKLCNLILGEGLKGGWQEARLVPPDASGKARLLANLNGSWQEVMAFPQPIHAPLVNRLRLMASLDRTGGVTDRRGALRVAANGVIHDLRLAVRLEPGGAEELTITFPARG